MLKRFPSYVHFALTRGAFLGMVGTMKTNRPPETMNEMGVQEEC